MNRKTSMLGLVFLLGCDAATTLPEDARVAPATRFAVSTYSKFSVLGAHS